MLPDKLIVKTKPKNVPLWKGPESSDPLGGITFSMLTNFLSDRERFRLKYVLGLKPYPKFNHRLEYGNMWHVCEEAHAAIPGKDYWQGKLAEYTATLSKEYPLESEMVLHWYNVCKRQFPHYVKYWSEHPDETTRIPLMQEHIFNIPYKLPNGKTVYLRGKFDSVDEVNGSIVLQENKTKGDIDSERIARQLTFDLQTMMYIVALDRLFKLEHKGVNPRISGVRYNVIRRPLSGGRGTIVRHKETKNKPAETWESFYSRLEAYFVEGPEYYFMRWDVKVKPVDIDNFKTRCLNPILTQLCDWYGHILSHRDPFIPAHINGIHWQHPFGSVNTLDEYGHTEYDEYLASGSTVGLSTVDTLFEELQ